MMRDSFGRAEALVQRLRELEGRLGRPIAGAEIGVHDGRLSAYVLRALPMLSWIMVDIWEAVPPESAYARSGDSLAKRGPAQVEADYLRAVQVTDFAGDRRRILKGWSVQVAAGIPDQSLEAVFIDASHTPDAVLSDLTAWVPKVRPGGLVSGHDWYPPDVSSCGVRPALDAYLATYRPEDRHFELGADATWFWMKPGDT